MIVLQLVPFLHPRRGQLQAAMRFLSLLVIVALLAGCASSAGKGRGNARSSTSAVLHNQALYLFWANMGRMESADRLGQNPDPYIQMAEHWLGILKSLNPVEAAPLEAKFKVTAAQAKAWKAKRRLDRSNRWALKRIALVAGFFAFVIAFGSPDIGARATGIVVLIVCVVVLLR